MSYSRIIPMAEHFVNEICEFQRPHRNGAISAQTNHVSDSEDLAVFEQANLFEPTRERPALLELESEFRALPKVDLHAHLSGCLRISTVRELLAYEGEKLSSNAASNLRNALSFGVPARSYAASFSPWRILNKITADPRIIGRLVLEVAEDFSKDGVVYSELRMSARLPILNGELNKYLKEVERAIIEARRLYNIDLRVILGLTRHIFRQLPPEAKSTSIDRMLEAAERYRGTTVVGFDLWGDETRCPPRLFASAFQQFHEAGFPITIHAGESGSCCFIREAIEMLHAQRIGHATLAVEDSEILALIKERGILVEACITSNWITGVVGEIENHPIKQILASGISVAVCSDDTLVYRTTLSQEFAKAIWFGLLQPEDIPKIFRNSAEGAFGSHLFGDRVAKGIQAASDDDFIERVRKIAEQAHIT